MTILVHHIVQDASSTRLVYEDLNRALSDPPKDLRPHIDYKAWADSFIALRDSPAATASVAYHVKRLSDLHLHKQALYPPAPLPRQAITESPDGLDYGFDAPGLLDLKTSHPGIIAAVVLKAAISLVDVSRTGYSHALFNNFEAGRTRFPFIPASLEALNPEGYEASDVNGPVMQGVCNLVEVLRSQPAIALLRHMQAEQMELTKQAHAPLRRIIDTLNASGNGAGDMVRRDSMLSSFLALSLESYIGALDQAAKESCLPTPLSLSYDADCLVSPLIDGRNTPHPIPNLDPRLPRRI